MLVAGDKMYMYKFSWGAHVTLNLRKVTYHVNLTVTAKSQQSLCFWQDPPTPVPYILTDIDSNTPHLIKNDSNTPHFFKKNISNTPHFNLSFYKYYKHFLKLSTYKYIMLINILNT